jgi:WD40 domain-containing protein
VTKVVPIASFPVHECAVCMALTPDGEHVVSSCHQEMKVWSRRSGEVIASIPERAFALAITLDDQTMITGTNDGEARVWRYGEWQAPYRTFQHYEGTLVAIRVARDEKILYANRKDAKSKLGNVGGYLVEHNLEAIGDPARERDILQQQEFDRVHGGTGQAVVPQFEWRFGK